MASELKNLSVVEGSDIPSAKGMRFGIVMAEWNYEVTKALTDGAEKTLLKAGVDEKDIIIKTVPGAFELTLGGQYLVEHENCDAIICIGCVIQGDTKHFDFICNSVAQGITNLNTIYKKPFIFGVLTPNTMEQALDRAGGKHGNKGDEAAVTAIKMLALKNSFGANKKPIGF